MARFVCRAAASALALLSLAALLAAPALAGLVDRGSLSAGSAVEGVLPRGQSEEAHHFKVACVSSLPEGLPVELELELHLKAESAHSVRALVSSQGLATPASHQWEVSAAAPLRLDSASLGSWPEAGVFYVTLFGSGSYAVQPACATRKVTQPPAHLRAAAVAAASVAAVPVAVYAGVPVNGSATSAASSYYSFAPTHTGCNLTVALAALQGDPDLYGSLTVQNPGPGNASWWSNYWGDDYILVPNVSQTVYIGVRSFTASSIYTLVVTENCTSGQDAVELTSGQPVAADGQALFQLQTRSNTQQITIEVTPETGDPDVYVAVNRPVSTTSFDWTARAWGADSITILPTDPKFCSAAQCTYNILVVPFGFADTVYSVTATVGQGWAELQAGVPYSASSEGGLYQYFTVAASLSATQDLTITVTATDGDPDLFVSTMVTQPNFYNGSFWSSRYIGSDAITIGHTDPHACYGCTYFVGVQCFGRRQCAYTIEASFGEPVDLEDGEPVYGSVVRNAMNYYVIRAQRGVVSQFDLTLTPVTGYCFMYLRMGSYPNSTTYDAVTSSDSSAQSLSVNVPSTPCNPGAPLALCVYYVAVTGSSDCDYQVVYSTGSVSSAVQLDDGVPFDAVQTVGTYDYYSFYYSGPDSSQGGTLTFQVTTLSGDADLYVTFPPNANPRPSQDVYNASSTAWGDDEVVVSNAAAGTYFVGVYAFTNNSYTITAEASSPDDNSVIDLEEDSVVTAEVGEYDYQYFLVTVAPDHGDVDVTATCEYGQVSLYMSTTDFFPTFERYQFSGFNDLHVPASEITGTQYYIGAYAGEDSLCDFSAQTSSASGLTELSEGVAVRGRMAAQGASTYYRYYHTGFTSVRFVLTPQGAGSNPGDTDLYISTVARRPNVTTAQWSGTSLATEVVIIEPTDPHFCVGCDYYAAAYAYTANVSYTLVATEIDVLYLTPGEVQVDSVQTGHYAYYNLYAPASDGTVTLTVELLPKGATGSVDVLVNQGDSGFPTERDYMWKANAGATGKAIINISQSSSDCGDDYACIYKISTVGIVGAQYQITVDLSDS